MPILWHIMKTYSSHGVNEFIICCGYKGYVIKEYFANYFLHMSDITFNMKDNSFDVHQNNAEPWTVTLVDTGLETLTGGRLKRVQEYIKDEESFCFTYGDGLSNVNISALILYHKKFGKEATLTAVRPQARFGAIKINSDGLIDHFQEKPDGVGSWINGGFFVLSPKVIERIEGDQTSWEGSPLSELASDAELAAFQHDGFWQPMDTLREKILLNNLWNEDKAPWKTW
jgi:glucose-1-phosphate cytidylyltransferase